jgi:hypothetical protein
VYNCRRVPFAPLSFKALANLVIGANQVCAAIFCESIININNQIESFVVLIVFWMNRKTVYFAVRKSDFLTVGVEKQQSCSLL